MVTCLKSVDALIFPSVFSFLQQTSPGALCTSAAIFSLSSGFSSFCQQLSQSMNFRSMDNMLQLKDINNYYLYFNKIVFILYFSVTTWPY